MIPAFMLPSLRLRLAGDNTQSVTLYTACVWVPTRI
jgi:hypothetical protein